MFFLSTAEDTAGLRMDVAAQPGRRARLLAALEVMLCTDVPATVLVQGMFAYLGFQAEAIFRSSLLIAVFLMCTSAVVLLTIAGILALRGESWRTLTGHDCRWRREVAIGLGTVPALFLGTALVATFFRLFLPGLVTDRNPILAMITTPSDVFWFLLMAISSGGIKEEIQRAFALRRFEKYLGGMSTGLLVWTIYFGAGHLRQGVDNAVGAGVLGLIFGLTYIWRQSLAAPMAAHAVYDTTVVLFWYFSTRGPV